MILQNRLGINNQVELSKAEEKISKQKAKQLFDLGDIDKVEVGTFKRLCFMHEYLSAMQRSVVKDIEIKWLLKNALTDKINDRDLFMKGIDVSYYYEGYSEFKTKEL